MLSPRPDANAAPDVATVNQELATLAPKELTDRADALYARGHTAIAAGNLGIKYFGVDRFDEAEGLLLESLRVRQAANGERHPSTAHAWILLGVAQLGGDEPVAAE